MLIPATSSIAWLTTVSCAFLCSVPDKAGLPAVRLSQWCEAVSMDQSHASWQRRLLQTHVLWHSKLSVHGGKHLKCCSAFEVRSESRLTSFSFAVLVAAQMTPSLACANKCVFCWRHHTNPTGREWRWEVDKPQFLLESAMSAHRALVKQMKGVPGVKPERLEEAQRIRHCALSLVGEPIMVCSGMCHEFFLMTCRIFNGLWCCAVVLCLCSTRTSTSM
jgi:hypothetical protein